MTEETIISEESIETKSENRIDTWEWVSRIKGIGKENYPKVVGLIEQ